MVAELAQWPWSSYACHALSQPGPLPSALPCWHTLANTEERRQAYWRRWTHTPLSERELEALRRSVTSGRPFGEAGWAERTIAQLALRCSDRPRGRPRRTPKEILYFFDILLL